MRTILAFSRRFAPPLSAGLLVSCAGMPAFQKPDEVDISSILYSVECIVADSVKERFGNNLKKPKDPWLNDWAALVTLELIADRTMGGGAKANFTVPVHHYIPAPQQGPFLARKFSMNFDGSYSRQVKRTGTVQAAFNFDAIEVCTKETKPKKVKRIDGELGLKDWIGQSVVALDNIHQKPTSLSYEVEFIITKKLELAPNYHIDDNIYHTTKVGSSADFSFKFAPADVKSHKLTIVAEKRKDREGKETAPKKGGVRKSKPVMRSTSKQVSPQTLESLDLKYFTLHNNK
ncbi:hypothetical protein [Rhodobium gokarnense]|uniref:Lipoprotein n=1 Tax=Rhodobium gokarnense TaxID=364296 RepID=A0ABT3HIA7_9HYPH|nr:hypothetical protein [Rhodobium gokarnense]MCW2310135.1 hypothetical protein [Rhodobium gokarnense]